VWIPEKNAIGHTRGFKQRVTAGYTCCAKKQRRFFLRDHKKTMALLETGEYAVNGRKWWITGAGSLHCKIMILMGTVLVLVHR
jgi:hypothetical protein